MTMFANVPEVLHPLLPELAESLAEYLGVARQAVERGDALAAADAAHAVKGAAMRFELAALSGAAAEFEDMCRMLPRKNLGPEARKNILPALEQAEGALSAFQTVLAADRAGRLQGGAPEINGASLR